MVLIIRGLGARWLGCYGNEWVATPNFDRIAASGVVYDECYAEAPGEVPPVAAEVKTLSLLPPWNAPAEIFEDYYEEGGTPITEPRDGDDWERVHASFAAAVTMMDAEVGRLLDSHPGADWIITSDGGFPLGEHDTVGRDASGPFEELAHVPLMVKYADRRDAGLRIGSLLAWSDLSAIVRGESVPPRERLKTTTSTGHAIRTADWTLIRRGENAELFQRPADRNEVNDVARMHADVVEAFG